MEVESGRGATPPTVGRRKGTVFTEVVVVALFLAVDDDDDDDDDGLAEDDVEIVTACGMELICVLD